MKIGLIDMDNISKKRVSFPNLPLMKLSAYHKKHGDCVNWWVDKNKLQTVESLIKNAAFMAVSLEELQEIINAEGYVVEYQNGENQKGTKQSDAVKTHIAMTKNHAAIIKQLTDLVPPEKKKESKLQALRDE